MEMGLMCRWFEVYDELPWELRVLFGFVGRILGSRYNMGKFGLGSVGLEIQH